MVVRNFFTFYVSDRTPRGGKSQTMGVGVSGHFGLGRPLARREIRGWAKKGKMQFPGARGTFGGGIWTPQKFLPESAQPFTFYVLADRTPTGGKLRNTGFVGHSGLGRPLALR